MGSEQRVTHKGQCHCKTIQFEFDAGDDLVAWECDCSVCFIKRNVHFIVPVVHFRLLQGQDKLSLYQFGTNTAKHYFCSNCGITSYYIPRSNPDGVAVTANCVEMTTVKSVVVRQFNGQSWEAAYQATGIAKQSA